MSQDPKSARSGRSRDDASRRGKGEADQRGPGVHDDPGARREPQIGSGAGSADPGPEPMDDPGMPEAVKADAHGDADDGSLEAELEAVRAELAEQQDRYLRTAAEAENIRRRADNDIANARKFAVESFAAEILTVRDSLEIARSLEISEDDAGAVAKMKEGLDLTLKQLDSALSKFSIEVVAPEQGDRLDPDRHQAMTTQESDNVPPNHILAVIQKGYTIHGRLLRPAMVVVARKPQDEARPEGETA